MRQSLGQPRGLQAQCVQILRSDGPAAHTPFGEGHIHQRAGGGCVFARAGRCRAGHPGGRQLPKRLGIECRAIGAQGAGRHQPLAIGQVQHPRRSACSEHRFAQQARQEAVELLLGGDGHAQIEKPPDGGLHALQRHGKVAGLLDQGRDLDGLLEIEMPDGIHIAHQAAQGLRNRACQHPGQGDRQHDDQQGGQGRPFGMPGACKRNKRRTPYGIRRLEVLSIQ